MNNISAINYGYEKGQLLRTVSFKERKMPSVYEIEVKKREETIGAKRNLFKKFFKIGNRKIHNEAVRQTNDLYNGYMEKAAQYDELLQQYTKLNVNIEELTNKINDDGDIIQALFDNTVKLNTLISSFQEDFAGKTKILEQSVNDKLDSLEKKLQEAKLIKKPGFFKRLFTKIFHKKKLKVIAK